MAKDSHDSVTRHHEEGHPENVGKSTTRRGEDMLDREGKEPGRYEVEEEGEERPVGKSTLRDVTGVNPGKPKS
jgi:hypothetical protein